MVSPALTLEASAVLVMAMVAQLTVIPTEIGRASCRERVEIEAVVVTVQKETLVGGEGTWTWVLGPPDRSAGPKCSAPEEMLHPELELAVSMVQLSPALLERLSLLEFRCVVLLSLLDTVTT